MLQRFWYAPPLAFIAIVIFNHGPVFLIANFFYFIAICCVAASAAFILQLQFELPKSLHVFIFFLYSTLAFTIYRISFGQPNLFEIYQVKSLYELPSLLSGLASFTGYALLITGLFLKNFAFDREESIRLTSFSAIFGWFIHLLYLNSMIVVVQRVFDRSL